MTPLSFKVPLLLSGRPPAHCPVQEVPDQGNRMQSAYRLLLLLPKGKTSEWLLQLILIEFKSFDIFHSLRGQGLKRKKRFLFRPILLFHQV